MPGVDIRIDLDDRLTDRLARAAADGNDFTEPMVAIADLLGDESDRFFSTETGPDGVPWIKSKRAEADGGRTLYEKGNLQRAVDTIYDSRSATVGVLATGAAAIYARIHQLGGTIRPRVTGNTDPDDPARDRRALNTPFGPRASVTLPARPYLGLSDEGGRRVTEILVAHLDSLIDGAAA